MNETESLRIEDELQKHKMAVISRKDHASSRDSGVVADDPETKPEAGTSRDDDKVTTDQQDKRLTLASSLSNSLLELAEQNAAGMHSCFLLISMKKVTVKIYGIKFNLSSILSFLNHSVE